MEDIHVFVCLSHTGREKRKFEQCHYKEIWEDRYLPYLAILWDLDNERKTEAIKVEGYWEQDQSLFFEVQKSRKQWSSQQS